MCTFAKKQESRLCMHLGIGNESFCLYCKYANSFWSFWYNGNYEENVPVIAKEIKVQISLTRCDFSSMCSKEDTDSTLFRFGLATCIWLWAVFVSNIFNCNLCSIFNGIPIYKAFIYHFSLRFGFEYKVFFHLGLCNFFQS
jgi:hypothetical protein